MSDKKKLIDEIFNEIEDGEDFEKKTDEPEFCTKLCEQIVLYNEDNIRYVALCRLPGLKLGEQKRSENLILTEKEREEELVESCLRHLTRRDILSSKKLGKIQYSSVVHQNVTKLVIPITNQILLYVTVEKDFDYHPMLHEIIDFINQNLLNLDDYSVPKWLTKQ